MSHLIDVGLLGLLLGVYWQADFLVNHAENCRILLAWASLDVSWECLGRQVSWVNRVKIRRILLVWVSLDISWECLGRQVLSRNHAKIRRIPLVSVSSDMSWECLSRQVLSLDRAKIRCILLVWVSLEISWDCLDRQVWSPHHGKYVVSYWCGSLWTYQLRFKQFVALAPEVEKWVPGSPI